MPYINWNIISQSENEVRCLTKALGCSDTVAKLLINRGFSDCQQARSFLEPSVSSVHDPFKLLDMEKAVSLIVSSIKNNKRICIYGDYDVDGITSVSVLYLYLKKFTQNVGYYIPDRFSQGYGVNDLAIFKICKENYDLIITVDTGTSAFSEIEYAKSLGLNVIVTDHHECQDNLPAADAIVNPKRHDDSYPFSNLAGVGVVYKLVSALDIAFGTSYCDEFIDLVAIGTIADIMPLLDENRYIVKKGLEKISSSCNFGLKCLIDICVQSHQVTSASIGFAIAPRINAAGRMYKAEIGVELFSTEDPDKAVKIAEQLCELNTERQRIENEIMNEAIQIIEEHDLNTKYSILVLWKEGWHSGVIGIVASKLKEKYNKPVILFSVDEVSKGSGRSVAPFNLYSAFEKNKDLLIQFGGHKYAAGVLLDNDNLAEFRDRMSKCVDSFLECSELSHELSVECCLDHNSVCYKTVTDISQLQPFGKHNEVPLFCVRNIKIIDIFPLSNNRHLRIKLLIGDRTVNAVYFSVDMAHFDYREGDLVDVICELSENDYRNHKSIQLIIRDIRYSKDILASFESRRMSCDRSEYVFSSHLPTRGDIAVVYRFFHQAFRANRRHYNLDTISNIINKDCLVSLSYEKVYYSLKILLELKIVIGSINGTDLIIDEIVDGKKFSLTDSSILTYIYEKAGVKFGN